ncbi:transposase [Skermanella mucosa]|uniref:transposase n=1 Tax=Skermanella mucosa TaxID=1789672 RepID=UPI00192B5842|nr:transposase [Skermanella mucosa]UEM21345.1 transposase [Skermanella mucosa]
MERTQPGHGIGIDLLEAEGVPPSALFIASPYDPEAHFAKKRSTSWVGYEVHLTESCEDNQPHLITHVEITAAPVADGDVLETIHHASAADGLFPAVHLTDTGYVDAKRLLSSRTRYDVDLLGPTRGDYHRRGRENKGFAAQDFTIDWERRQAICPAGQTSANWVPTQEPRGKPVIGVNVASSTCKACPHRLDCIDADGVRRTLTLQVPELQIALQAARHREKTAEFREQYGKRAGIEGTISQGVRAFHLRRSRYIGQAKTHLQHLLIAAIDLGRIYCWLIAEPRAQTRQLAFTALMMPKGRFPELSLGDYPAGNRLTCHRFPVPSAQGGEHEGDGGGVGSGDHRPD